MDFAQPPSSASASAAAAQQDDDSVLSTVDNKIMADLNVVIEKMDLLDSMLKPSGGADTTNKDALLTVIGFLEACAPRMIELVEAAAQGALSGSVLEKCLGVNDRLLKRLQEVDTMVSTTTTTTTKTSAAAASTPVKEMAEFTLDDFDDDDDGGSKTNATAAPLGDSKPAAAGPSAAAAESTTISDEPDNSFDDFFAERTSAPSKPEG